MLYIKKIIDKTKTAIRLALTFEFEIFYLAIKRNTLNAISLNKSYTSKYILAKFKTASRLLFAGDFQAFYLALLKKIYRPESNVEDVSPLFQTISSAPLALNQPLVTVIIPCFNYGEFIKQAVDSVLNQTLKNLEILIIDGGSSDGKTIPFLRNFSRPKTEIFFRGGRHYVGSNRNFGMARARGKYICCLDADDSLEPTYLEKAVFILETYGFDIVSTATKFVGARQGRCDILERPTLLEELRGNHILTCAVFKKDLWLSVGGFHDFGVGKNHVAEDWEFWVRALADGARVRNISGEYLFNYRIHNGGVSLSSDKSVRSLRHQKKAILKKNKKLINPHSIKNSYLQNAKNFRCPPSLNAFTNAGNFIDSKFKKKIIVFVPYFMVGGAERLLSGLCKYLSMMQWEVIVVSTNDYDGTFGSSQPWFSKWSQEVYELPKFLKIYEYFDFVESLMISRSPDFIINAGSQFLYDSVGALSKKHVNTCYVDLLFNTIGHVASHLKHKKNFQMAFCESDEVFGWYIKNGWPANKVKKLLSGVDLEMLIPPKYKASLPNLVITDNEFVVGFSGRLSIEKAPDIFLEIAKLSGCTNLHFVMTGAGPMESDLAAKISDLTSNTKFTYLGLVDDVSRYIASYDVLVLPSRADGRPLVVMEALALGVPVIAANVGALPELVEDGVSGYIIPNLDPHNFYNKIQLLANSKELHLKMKKSARNFAEMNLDAKKAYRGYELALLEAVAKDAAD